MINHRRIVILLGTAVIALSGCETDDAVEKDAKNAAPEVEQAGKEVEDETKEAGRAVEKEVED